MKVIALQKWARGFDLKSADLTCQSLSELTVYNIRRLFSNRGSEWMDHQLQWSGAPPRTRKLWVDTLDPDE